MYKSILGDQGVKNMTSKEEENDVVAVKPEPVELPTKEDSKESKDPYWNSYQEFLVNLA